MTSKQLQNNITNGWQVLIILNSVISGVCVAAPFLNVLVMVTVQDTNGPATTEVWWQIIISWSVAQLGNWASLQ